MKEMEKGMRGSIAYRQGRGRKWLRWLKLIPKMSKKIHIAVKIFSSPKNCVQTLQKLLLMTQSFLPKPLMSDDMIGIITGLILGI